MGPITLLAFSDICVRPKALEVLHHPLFWNSDRRMSFLRDTSDRVELEDREVDSIILRALESTAPVSLGGRWDEKLEPAFITNIGRYRRYKYNSVRDLLRVIRNKLNHYRELPTEIQVCFLQYTNCFERRIVKKIGYDSWLRDIWNTILLSLFFIFFDTLCFS